MRLLLLSLLACPLAIAQSSETYIEQAGLTFEQSVQDVALAGAASGESPSGALGGASVLSNTASIAVQGDANMAALEQSGIGNVFSLAIVGSDNVFGLLQLGSDNRFQGEVFGDGNLLTNSIQSGRDNTYRLRLDGVSDSVHSILQFGDGNSATQVVGAGLTPASIEQYGGATVSIVRR